MRCARYEFFCVLSIVKRCYFNSFLIIGLNQRIFIYDHFPYAFSYMSLVKGKIFLPPCPFFRGMGSEDYYLLFSKEPEGCFNPS